jgi:predicted DNA-binding protein with PD1-like motif
MLLWRFLLVALVVVAFCYSSGSATKADDLWWARKKASNETATFSQSRVHVLRLGPGEDLLDSLWRYARVTKIKAASVVSVVGSLTDTNIRYADQENGTSLHGHFEIVSVVGNIDLQKEDTPDNEGNGHIHIACSNEEGVTIGGHALVGNVVYTTAEIILLELSNGLFDRILDNGPEGSGYYELQVLRANGD